MSGHFYKVIAIKDQVEKYFLRITVVWMYWYLALKYELHTIFLSFADIQYISSSFHFLFLGLTPEHVERYH